MSGAWLPNGMSFLSGLPEKERRDRRIVVIQAYVDESGGKGQSSVFVFSALVATANDWANFSDQWRSILDEPPKVDYFKFYEASRRKEQFKRFSVRQRDDKIKKLLAPIRGAIEVFCVADMAGFAETLEKYNERPLKDPYFQQFHILIMAISLTLLDMGIKERFEIFFDEHRIFGPKAKAWYPIVRDICDEDIRSLMPVEPHFETDKEFLPLQAADMLAGLRRAWNDNALDRFGLSWMVPELENNSGILLSAHSQYLDTERMKRIVKMSYSAETQKRVRELVREYKRKLGPDWTPPYMSKKRTAPTEFQRFDDGMGKLLSVSHDELKAKLDAEKAQKKIKTLRSKKGSK